MRFPCISSSPTGASSSPTPTWRGSSTSRGSSSTWRPRSTSSSTRSAPASPVRIDGLRLGWPRTAVGCEFLRPVRFEDDRRDPALRPAQGRALDHLRVRVPPPGRADRARPEHVGVLRHGRARKGCARSTSRPPWPSASKRRRRRRRRGGGRRYASSESGAQRPAGARRRTQELHVGQAHAGGAARRLARAPRRRSARRHRTVRVGQEHAAAPDRHARSPDLRDASSSTAAPFTTCPSPSSPPSATATSASCSRIITCCRSTPCSRTSCCRRWRQGPRPASRSRIARASSSSASAWPTGSTTGRPSCRAARRSASRSRARSCSEPRLLLCDEPTGNLDPATARSIADLLFELHASFRSILVVVTHSLELARRFKRRVELRDGRLVEP